MKVSKYWAKEVSNATDKKGLKYFLVSWGGSNSSISEAQVKATEKIEKWKTKLLNGESLGDYPYVDKDQIKEELVKEIVSKDGELQTAITRNRYGALILNSADTFFADVDLPYYDSEKKSIFNKIISLFIKEKIHNKTDNLKEEYLEKFLTFHENNKDINLRIYETAGGFRIIATNRSFDPTKEDTKRILKDLESDSLYIRLCRTQECFRARLTPKPWRCGFKGPPNKYPRKDKRNHDAFLKWLNIYEEKSKNYSVCRLVRELGSNPITESARSIIEIHDNYVLNSKSDRLA